VACILFWWMGLEKLIFSSTAFDSGLLLRIELYIRRTVSAMRYIPDARSMSSLVLVRYAKCISQQYLYLVVPMIHLAVILCLILIRKNPTMTSSPSFRVTVASSPSNVVQPFAVRSDPVCLSSCPNEQPNQTRRRLLPLTRR